MLDRTLAHLGGQSRRPDAVVVSAPDASHVDAAAVTGYPLHHVFGASGCTAQRNRALASGHVRDADIVVFFDDDFVPDDRYLERVEAAFVRHPEWAVLTGLVLADGIKGPGIDYPEACEILARLPDDDTGDDTGGATGDATGRYEHVAPAGAYGCNMAFRAADIAGQRFDERLPLYGWQEDTDFSRRVARGRPIVRSHGLRGVHLGVKRGRVSGVRFGYSQVVNPLYLVRKGTCTWRWAANLITRNVLANAALSFRAEPHVDRAGRLRGNLIAAGHLIRGRVDPEFIMRL